MKGVRSIIFKADLQAEIDEMDMLWDKSQDLKRSAYYEFFGFYEVDLQAYFSYIFVL